MASLVQDSAIRLQICSRPFKSKLASLTKLSKFSFRFSFSASSIFILKQNFIKKKLKLKNNFKQDQLFSLSETHRIVHLNSFRFESPALLESLI